MNNSARSPYFVNAWVDFLLIGGASIIAFILLKTFHSGARTEVVYGLAGWLVWVCNWPHFSATSYRLYSARENTRQYPVTAWVVPFLVLLGISGSFLSPEGIAPYFVKLFLIWSPYHFSGQSLGITLVYSRRNGVEIGRFERFALSCFIFGTYISQTVRSETGTMGMDYYGIKTPGLGLPPWVNEASVMLMYGAAFCLGLFVISWSVMKRRPLPWIILLPCITQYIWFVPGANLASFQEFVPFFHSLQYLLIAWSMQLKEKMDRTQAVPSGRYVLGESARWGVMNFIGGSILFYFLPMLFSSTSGYPMAMATGIIIAGVQIHHFFVDGVIWKLKRKTVASPLMMNIRDLLKKPALVTATAAEGAGA